jgi:hypothetical protein
MVAGKHVLRKGNASHFREECSRIRRFVINIDLWCLRTYAGSAAVTRAEQPSRRRPMPTTSRPHLPGSCVDRGLFHGRVSDGAGAHSGDRAPLEGRSVGTCKSVVSEDPLVEGDHGSHLFDCVVQLVEGLTVGRVIAQRASGLAECFCSAANVSPWTWMPGKARAPAARPRSYRHGTGRRLRLGPPHDHRRRVLPGFRTRAFLCRGVLLIPRPGRCLSCPLPK